MTTGWAGFDRSLAGEASSCGCAMCRPVSYLPQAAWSNPQALREWVPQYPMPKLSPSRPLGEAIRAQIVARIQAELDALKTLSMPEDDRARLERQILLWVREVVSTMDLSG